MLRFNILKKPAAEKMEKLLLLLLFVGDIMCYNSLISLLKGSKKLNWHFHHKTNGCFSKRPPSQNHLRALGKCLA